MVQATSFAPQVSTTSLYGKENKNNFASNVSTFAPNTNTSIAPQEKKTVTIDGKTYPVIKVQDNNPMVSSFAPRYKEVVVIDGKQYDVEQGFSMGDVPNETVTVDGKTYSVDSNLRPSLSKLFNLDFSKFEMGDNFEGIDKGALEFLG